MRPSRVGETKYLIVGQGVILQGLCHEPNHNRGVGEQYHHVERLMLITPLDAVILTAQDYVPRQAAPDTHGLAQRLVTAVTVPGYDGEAMLCDIKY